jgi:outer membrane protein TolC
MNLNPKSNSQSSNQESNMKRVLLLTGSILMLLTQTTSSQSDTINLDIDEIIALAQSEAPEALLASTRMKNRYWAFQSNLADFRPAISFQGDLPDLNRSISEIVLPNGSSSFVQRAQMRNSMGVSLSQSILQTGGTVYVGSGLQRLDIFQTSNANTVSYYSTPLYVGFVQPVFGFNRLKWNKKIEPLRYQEATREYAEQMEGLAYRATELFFEVYIAQFNLRSAIIDKTKADSLLLVSIRRQQAGRIGESERLQLELSVMNAESAVQQWQINLQNGTERLRNFLGLKRAIVFQLNSPDSPPAYTVENEQALAAALASRSNTIEYERRLAEADQAVAAAKANSGLRMNITGMLSLSQTDTELERVYQNPLDNERLGISINIPIADWGKAKARLQTALTNREYEIMNIDQQRVNFELEILLKVRQFELLRQKFLLSQRTFEISEIREGLTRAQYLNGSANFTELQLALAEKEKARQNHVQALRACWLAHFDLRRATLYDFLRRVSLVKRLDGF